MGWFILGLLKKTKIGCTDTQFISVIVAAHNEEKHLGNCLEALMEQNYPKDKYEIIIVNDRSTDKTQKIIDEWKAQFVMIKSYKIGKTPKNHFPKKNALMAGIKMCQGEILCFTDADCIPAGNWVRSCAQAYTQKTDMVIGVAPLLPANRDQKCLWQQLLAYESWFVSFISISAIHNNFPLTCSGRNLSYRKSTFLKLNGFATIAHSLSGDDDLLMHQFQKYSKGKIGAIAEPNSMVTSETAETLTQLWRQKTRHFSAGKYYPVEKKIFYLIWNVSNIFITVLPIIALFFNFVSFAAAILFLGAKLLMDIGFHSIGFKKYNHVNLLKYFFLFELIYPFYILIVGNIGLLKNPKW